MKKRNTAFLILLGLFAALLSACLFDSDDSALSSWLSDQGLPDSYDVQTLTVEGLEPENAKAFVGRTEFYASEAAVFGTQAGLTHDIVIDFDVLVKDSAFLDSLANADSAAGHVALFIDKDFYTSKYFPKDSLPYEETLQLEVEWILEKGKKKSFFDSVLKIPDSTWRLELQDWETENSADTTYDLTVSEKDSVLKLPMPLDLIEDIKSAGKIFRLQLRISAPESKRLYRVLGPKTLSIPTFYVRASSDTTYKPFSSFRMSEVVTFNDTCDDCLLLHGGVLDSIVVEYPTDKIMDALSDLYGDEFPFDEGNGVDVRQAVVLAQLMLPRDDSEGVSELGLPIQVVVASYVDSLGTEIRKMEEYKPNRTKIPETGHPNMVFYDGDSLALQVTFGVRDLINQAKDGRNLKIMVRLGRPVLQATDPVYQDYTVKDSVSGKIDTSYVFLPNHFDYARYDFGTSFSQPATLKLWLATKRGGKK